MNSLSRVPLPLTPCTPTAFPQQQLSLPIESPLQCHTDTNCSPSVERKAYTNESHCDHYAQMRRLYLAHCVALPTPHPPTLCQDLLVPVCLCIHCLFELHVMVPTPQLPQVQRLRQLVFLLKHHCAVQRSLQTVLQSSVPSHPQFPPFPQAPLNPP